MATGVEGPASCKRARRGGNSLPAYAPSYRLFLTPLTTLTGNRLLPIGYWLLATSQPRPTPATLESSS